MLPCIVNLRQVKEYGDAVLSLYKGFPNSSFQAKEVVSCWVLCPETKLKGINNVVFFQTVREPLVNPPFKILPEAACQGNCWFTTVFGKKKRMAQA